MGVIDTKEKTVDTKRQNAITIRRKAIWQGCAELLQHTNPRMQVRVVKAEILRKMTLTGYQRLKIEHYPDNAILTVGTKKNKPITVQLELNGQQVLMQVDMGAAVTLMAVGMQQELFPDAHLEQASVKLQTYTAEPLAVLGTMEVQVKYGNYIGKHVLYVVNRNCPTLLGWDWLMTIKLDWHNLGVATVQTTSLTLIEVSIR